MAAPNMNGRHSADVHQNSPASLFPFLYVPSIREKKQRRSLSVIKITKKEINNVCKFARQILQSMFDVPWN